MKSASSKKINENEYGIPARRSEGDRASRLDETAGELVRDADRGKGGAKERLDFSVS
jgi:hypothetical protein